MNFQMGTLWDIRGTGARLISTMAFTRRNMLTGLGWGLGGFAATAAGATLIRPKAGSGAMPPYFARLDQALKQANLYEPVMLLDLDRVDHNIAVTKKYFSNDLAYRLSAKSLPSVELQNYILNKMGANKVMAFHVPYLSQYLGYGPDTDILMGKPVLTGSVHNFFASLDAGARSDAAARIQWLADDSARVGELLTLAKQMGVRLRLNLEIDVGLHRGGAQSTDELGAMLNLIAAHPDHISFAGFMGYEGHVAAAPAPLANMDQSFADAMAAYQRFYEFGTSNFGALFTDDVTLNSGGSKTYQRFGTQPFVNDIAAGSCMVKPSTFDILHDHVPALFIATPILKAHDGLLVPFLEERSTLLSWWNPNAAQSWTVYGGGWAADMVAPKGVSILKLTADPPNQNLMPNQSLYTGPKGAKLHQGDFIFMQPHQGDALFQFETIALVRNGEVTGFWSSFDRKY